MPPKPQPEKPDDGPVPQHLRSQRFRRELVGIFVGLAVALMISAVVPEIRARYSLGIVVLWGGAIGGLLASYERFERAGASLTRRESPVLNYIVGLGIPVLILALLYYLLQS